MRPGWSCPGPDRWETRANVGLGLAVVLSLGIFGSAMVRVVDEGPRIAQALGRSPAVSTDGLAVTNDPAGYRIGEEAERGLPRAGGRSRTVLSSPM